MTRWILASLPLLALAACNKAPDEPKTVEQATAEMKDSAVKMLPGPYNIGLPRLVSSGASDPYDTTPVSKPSIV